jgi:hypothetical protein
MKTHDVSESRVLPMRPARGEGLYALASAWRASGGSVHPFVRPARAQQANATLAFDRPEPPYLPDGPTAA